MDNSKTYYISRFLYVRGIALIFLIAFISLHMQVCGLFGRDGILPIGDLMSHVSSSLSSPGLSKFFIFPTIFWFDSSNGFLIAACVVGELAALAATLGLMSMLNLFVCWLFYLSFVISGSEFMSFQWDILLLEAGFLSIIWAPPAVLSFPFKKVKNAEEKPSLVGLWLLRWLLFRLMFMSGLCKILSGDTTWLDMTALVYHFETQPLPTPLAWFAHHMPLWWQKLSCIVMFIIELGAPFLIFTPARLRHICFLLLVSLQILILLTGNYTFFNLLTILLCTSLIEDSFWKKLLSENQTWVGSLIPDTAIISRKRFIALPLVALVLFMNFANLSVRHLGFSIAPVRMLMAVLEPYHLANSYGLFAVMTTSRVEIQLEGSSDGETWKAYEFKFKPGSLRRAPPVVAPFQPRLDWQMWFAALGTLEDNTWFTRFAHRLLAGSKDVTYLLAYNPFPKEPPKFLRAKKFEYHFSSWNELITGGQWWTRDECGDYMPVVSL